MPAFLSIVIPTLNSAETINHTLLSLSEGIISGLIKELIISDGNSEDDIEKLSKEIGAVFIKGEKGRGKQLHRGAVQSNAKWIFFIHSDTILPLGWSQIFLEHIINQESAGYCKLSFDDTSIMAKIISFSANLRSNIFKLPYGDQGLLISKKLYNKIGGYPDLPLMEDVEIAKLLKKKIRLIPATIKTSAYKYKRDGWFKRSINNIIFLMKFKCGVDPYKLAKSYYKN